MVGDDDVGKRWVYFYLVAETGDVRSEMTDALDGVSRRHRLQEFPVTDDPSWIANQVLKQATLGWC